MSERATQQQQSASISASTTPNRGLLQRACACGAHSGGAECASCREKRERTLQRAAAGSGPDVAPPIVHDALRGSGRPLDPATRAFFEPRFGHDFSRVPANTPQRAPGDLTVGPANDPFEQEADHAAERVMRAPAAAAPGGRDFSQVRVHTGPQAAESARAVGARAYTVGPDIVFGEGEYAPQTSAGRHLLAHELAHTIQQEASGPSVQRRLVVDPNHPALAPATDPAAALTSAQRFSMMDSLIQGLCDLFEVDSGTGEVQAKSAQTLNPAGIAAGGKPVGCCCLNVLVNAPSTWTIEVSQVEGPQTLFGSRQVVLSPTNTPVEFGSFTAGGTLAFQGAVPAAGHELCGHAALEELGAHPIGQDRLTTDVHDPTVRIENLISTEQGVPASELRGLAASGPHRGESVDRITIQNYALNSTDVPASETSKLQFAASYIVANNSFVDVLGHSDSTGSTSAKQTVSGQRASKVQAALIAAGVPPTITKFSFFGAPRFTRVEGVSDSQPPAGALAANQANWRRAEILIAGFPAGAQRPPPGTPATVTPHTQRSTVPGLKASADPCVSLLVGGAYP